MGLEDSLAQESMAAQVLSPPLNLNCIPAAEMNANAVRICERCFNRRQAVRGRDYKIYSRRSISDRILEWNAFL